MTETKNHIPEEQHDRVKIEFDKHQRPKIYFDKLCQEEVRIERKTQDSNWLKIAEGVRSPYTDEDKLDTATQVNYRIIYGEEERVYEFQMNKHP
jgi:hypothetical protein